ncbi:MAG: peptide chain release factor N(5)-glutamine methyltransferase [Pirellulaceae bacterium]
MSSQEPWTIGRLLNWTADFLRQRGSESPQLDAQLLLAHARRCRRIDLFTSYGEVASDELRSEFRDLIRRRSEGTPVAYLTGTREFFSLEFHVTRDVLIPRPETEFVVLALLDLIKAHFPAGSSPAIVDVGTGSGILAICAARQVPGAQVWATDLSEAALAVARQNCERHGIAERVHLLAGDLLAPLPPEPPFDFVLSNPPYVSEPEYAALPRDVKDHEPRGALVGGPTGVEVIERLVPEAAVRLRPGGWLVLEISPQIESAVHQIIARDGHFEGAQTISDLAGLARVVQAVIRS